MSYEDYSIGMLEHWREYAIGGGALAPMGGLGVGAFDSMHHPHPVDYGYGIFSLQTSQYQRDDPCRLRDRDFRVNDATMLNHPHMTFGMNVRSSGTQPIQSSDNVVRARQQARKLAEVCAMRLVDLTKMVTAVSEVARNTVIYGKGGDLEWQIVEDGMRTGLRMTFRDDGPGIPDLRLAMTDGWTSGKGMGLGLTGAKRLVDDFALDTAPRAGTRVTICKWV